MTSATDGGAGEQFGEPAPVGGAEQPRDRHSARIGADQHRLAPGPGQRGREVRGDRAAESVAEAVTISSTWCPSPSAAPTYCASSVNVCPVRDLGGAKAGLGAALGVERG